MEYQRKIRVNLPLRKGPPWTVGVTATKGHEYPFNEATRQILVVQKSLYVEFKGTTAEQSLPEGQIPSLSSEWFCRQYGSP